MKRIFAIALTFVMAFSLLTGCGNPVHDDLVNYLNNQMTEVNANYEKITAEAATWVELEEVDALVLSLTDVLIPLVDDSLTKLSDINPETDEVKVLKDKYVSVMDAYKAGFELILAGVQENDEAKMTEGDAKINEGIALLDEYNQGLEALASEVGAEIEY